jgi:nucleoside-diphosphate-sugar epimerase
VVAAAKRHVVLGAAGGTGSAVVRELAARGLPVRAVTRRGTGDVPEGVEQVAADVGTAGGARQACEDAALVYYCAQPDYRKWPELFPPMTEAVLDGAAEASAKLVFADNLYVYGPPDGPMTEETPQRAEGRKGRTRIEMADAVLRAHADGRVRSTIGRSSDYNGPRGTGSTAGDNIMKPALRGKRTRWLGSLDQPHTLNYLEDTGRALVTLGERDEADGQVWHVPSAEPSRGAVPRAGVRGGRAFPKDRGCFAADDQDGGPVQPPPTRAERDVYQFEQPFVVDASKFQGAFGPFETTPHREAVRRTVAGSGPLRRLGRLRRTGSVVGRPRLVAGSEPGH